MWVVDVGSKLEGDGCSNVSDAGVAEGLQWNEGSQF